MQVFSGGNALGPPEFFDTAKEAFQRGDEVMESTPEADEVRVWRSSPKQRGVGTTRGSGATPKSKRKAQKRARRANR